MTHGKKFSLRAATAVASMVAASWSVATPLRQVDDDRWQVSIDREGPALRLSVRDKMSGQVVADNPNFLPRSLDQAGGDWSLSTFTVVAGQFTVAMRLHPQPGSGTVQDKRFSFDLRLPGLPLVAFETEVTRADQRDRQHFDLLQGKSSGCVMPAATEGKAEAQACTPAVETLNAAALIPLAALGPAEAYVPPITQLIVN